MTKSARQDTRVVAPVAMILEIDGKPDACFTRNISPGGMFVVTRQQAPVDSVVKISIFREGQRLETNARVVTATDDGLGLRFIHTGPEFGLGIAALIADILNEGGTEGGDETFDKIDHQAKAGVSWAHMPDGRSWNWWRKAVRGATLTSLSLDGAAMTSRNRPKVGDVVLFFITGKEIPDGRLSCQAEVVRHVGRGFAVKFIAPSIAFRRTVSSLRRGTTPTE